MFTAPNQTPWPYGSLRLINASGVPAQALNSAERIQQLNQNFQHHEGDVWIVSYVKSGTTWMIGIYASLIGHPASEYCGNLQKTTRTFCPQPELPDLGWGDNGFGHSIQELNDWPTKPRCFKSHWPNQDFMLGNNKDNNTTTATNGSKSSKFIYVMRNAKDQMISHWNQVWGMGFHYGTTDRDFHNGWPIFVQDWLDGNVENGQWFDHVAGWYSRSQQDPEHVLIIRYEDLKMNIDTTIQKVVNFLDLPQPSENEMTKILHLTSFEIMRKADENDIGLQFMRWLGVLRKHHIRQGETGGDTELKLTQEQQRAMEKAYEDKLKPLGMPREWVFLD